MFYESVRAASESGQVRVGLRPGGKTYGVSVEARGLVGLKAAFLSKKERLLLADAVIKQCRQCRTCGTALPDNSIQGTTWHRQCAGCYLVQGLPTCVDEATEIAVVIDGHWFRVFPHMSHDGMLAMRVLPNLASYVLLPNGAVRMRREDFVMSEKLPAQIVEEIALSFIVSDGRAEVARKIFAAFAAKDFEVID